jgi:site-specific DNA-methyltransferase (adenine-specific)
MLDNVTRGDCIEVMKDMRAGSVDLILTDPPYLVNYRDRSGRSVKNDDNTEWLDPAFAEMNRVLKDGGACLCFYAWNKIDIFMAAWKKAGFRVVGHVVFPKKYASAARFTEYRHEQAYLLVKGNATPPRKPPPDVIPPDHTRKPPQPSANPDANKNSNVGGIHETGRYSARPLLRFRLHSGRRARSGPPLRRHRTGRSPPRHSLLAPARAHRHLRPPVLPRQRVQRRRPVSRPLASPGRPHEFPPAARPFNRPPFFCLKRRAKSDGTTAPGKCARHAAASVPPGPVLP